MRFVKQIKFELTPEEKYQRTIKEISDGDYVSAHVIGKGTYYGKIHFLNKGYISLKQNVMTELKTLHFDVLSSITLMEED